MQWIFGLLATLCCGVFCGAAIYINAVEHPARMSCGVSAALAQWAPSYRRATVMQASLAVAGFIFSFVAWLLGAPDSTLIAGVLLGVVAPYTLIVVMPTNKQLETIDPAQDEARAKQLLQHWNRLHRVRSGLSLVAFVIFISAS